jgi:hypothetical protein
MSKPKIVGNKYKLDKWSIYDFEGSPDDIIKKMEDLKKHVSSL